jgi:two-component system, chemotaxis family, protein-glutamate methylesterase/glutaminase
VRALPEKLTHEPQYTGVVCVECPGVIGVRKEGSQGELRFTCRVGHAFSSNELIGGKEKKIEEWLWSAFESIKELAALLRDLQQVSADGEASYTPRIQTLERQAKLLGQILQSNDPVVLGAADAGDEPDAERGSP